MYLSKSDIESTPKIRRLNIINSITGIKPANLIATKSQDGQSNVAIFSSVVHLGSNPALIGFVFRPQHERPTNTYLNIKSTKFNTINQVPVGHVKNAHYTSAKFPKESSEFEACDIKEEYLYNFHAPFVKHSPIKIGLELVDEIPISINKTILVIGQINHLFVEDAAVDEAGHIDLEQLNAAGISGVSSYYGLQKKDRFPYAHLEDVPEFK